MAGGGQGGSCPPSVENSENFGNFLEIIYLFDFWHKLGVCGSTRSNLIHAS